MFEVNCKELAFINLRGNAGDSRFIDGVAAALGQQLPVAANTISQSAHRVYWLGPDEWQIVTELNNYKHLIAVLERNLRDQHVAVNDLSGGLTAYHLSGPAAIEILGKACTLDLHPSIFPVGACAQTGLAKAGMLLGHVEKAPVYEIIVRRSFSEYALRWLQHN